MFETSSRNQNSAERVTFIFQNENGIRHIHRREWKDKWLKIGGVVLIVALLCLLSILVVVLSTFFVAPFLKNGNNIPNCLLESMNLVSDDLKTTADNWSKFIDSGNYTEVLNILLECGFSDVTMHLLFKSVQTVYDGSLKNFPAVLKFVGDITSAWNQYNGYTALRAIMYKHDHDHTNEMMKLVYCIKIAMERHSADAKLIKNYKALLELVPESIYLILFEQCVSIRNQYSNEYLFLSNINSNSQRLVMTWTGDVNELRQSRPAFWSFQVELKNQELFFRLRNNCSGHSPICTSPEYFDMERGNTVECQNAPKLDSSWVVTPASKKPSFTIMNGECNLLYSPTDTNLYDTNRRYIFTWLGRWKDIWGHQRSYWDISRCQ